MRAVVLLLCGLLPLSACSDEPDFDSRFEQAEERIRDKARALDSELVPSENQTQMDETLQPTDPDHADGADTGP